MPNAMTCLTPTNGQSASEIAGVLDKQYNIIVAPNGGELKDKVFRVSHMGAITKDRAGEQLAEMGFMAAAGAVQSISPCRGRRPPKYVALE